ncbi:hypothetical protein [Anaerobaca lacustris]|uniref:DUF4190 domain-containing protein n=1 Tax=Anaerobaca lacustris TaxID=3044600 RepID=A0AAW6TZQ6_9BACT|nr:hypothetical protein [Sedimentisphaerales bacterium M17dextr]
MMAETDIQQKRDKRRATRKILLAIGAPLAIALACFVVLAILPEPEGPRMKDPLRSILTGLGVLGVAAPLCIGGAVLKQRFATSPYFEGKFIATVLSVFGFACVAAGLACIFLAIYDLLTPLWSQ